jgi:hypothetical protein
MWTWLAAETRNRIRHVLLLSLDGTHAVDFANCAKGIQNGNLKPS